MGEKLTIGYSVVGEPSDAVVEALTNALSEARAGRIKMVCIVCVDNENHGFHTNAWGESTNPLILLGAIERAKSRVLKLIEELWP